MKVVLISMPDIAPIMLHEKAIHMPNHGMACVGGHIDERHDVSLIDLVRKRPSIKKYLTRTLTRIQPDIIGLSAMTWQYNTCVRLIRLIRTILPDVKIALGGYHATLVPEEIAASADAALIDFMVRGEGEIPFRRLVNALDGRDNFADIPSLSFKQEDAFVHNKRAALCDLSSLGLPIRDQRRLTWGYHFIFNKIEVMETSRGCTRDCNFCSMRHMYGRSYRTYPIERVIEDLDYICRVKKTRTIFLVDDNLVLNPKWVDEICEAIIKKKYKDLNLIVQSDCISVAKNEDMVRKMSRAGFRGMFLGIENVSADHLDALGKADVVKVSKQAIDLCHKNDIMVIGGAIFGLPDDDEEAIRKNYYFLKNSDIDALYCQILTPYPMTTLRQDLLSEGLVANPAEYWKYNGLWANVRTRHLSTEQLQYFFWYYRQTIIGWWTPSVYIENQGFRLMSVWQHLLKPLMRFFFERKVRRIGWEGLYKNELAHLQRMNEFDDL
ncbi:MAG: radical SAM protein [Smithella sp.]|nr:radical SAM protein [Smithella sp.]